MSPRKHRKSARQLFSTRGQGRNILESCRLKTGHGQNPTPTGLRAAYEFPQVRVLKGVSAHLVEMGDIHVSAVERHFPKLIEDRRGWRVNEPLAQRQAKDRPFRCLAREENGILPSI